MNLYEENCVLRERITQLEELLGAHATPPLALGLTPLEGRLYGVLMKREYVTNEQCLAAMYTNLGKEPPSNNLLHMYMYRLRKKFMPFGVAIKTVRHVGFMIEPDQKKKLIAQLSK